MTGPSLQTLGRYAIHAELGKGGFATVYRATDTALERDVALKILKPGWTDDAKAVERFMREARQASRLKHPNIVTIYDVGQTEGRLFIAMELVRGRSLQQIIAEDGAMAWPRVLSILEQSAAALDYAHAEGLVHRDIKPANIILDESKPGSAVQVMLTDFGLVRGAEQASLSMGTTGGLLGTPEYIPPEIWDGEPATKASDIYALGCVAFYLLTGKVLFSATTPMAVLKRHAEGPVFPQQWPSGVPAGAEAVLRRALAKDPNQRPASAAELAAELHACEGQATREQAAREQEARRQEEAERAAQVMLAAEAARRTEEERTQQEATHKAKEEAERKAREEQERQRQAELAAALENSRREAAEREQQRQAVEKQAQRPQIGVPSAKTSAPAPKAKSNRKWLYAAAGVIAVVVFAIVLAGINPPPSAPAPAPAQPSNPTEAPANTAESPKPADTPAVEPFQGLAKAAPDCSYGGLMKSIEALDASTVRFTLCTPDAAFASKIAFASLGIQSAKHLEETGGKPLESALGTGPYMVEEWLRGDHLTLVANPNYWGDPPKTRSIVFRWNADSVARLNSLGSEVDGIDNPDPSNFDRIQADSSLKLYPREAPNVFYLGMNNTKPPFDNERVRQAIAMGIDRQTIVDKFYPPGSSAADYFTPCAIPGGCEGDPWYPFNPEKARALLAEAGFPDSFQTTLSYRNIVRSYLPTPSKVAQDIQAQLKQNLNIDVVLDEQESATFFENLSQSNLKMFFLGWGADYPDPTNFLDPNFGTGASNQFGQKFDDLTAALTQAGSLSDQAVRNELYAQVNSLIKQHVPMVPIAHSGSATVWKAIVEGALSNPLGDERFELMSIPSVPGQDTLIWMQAAEPVSLYCSDETDMDSFRVCEQIFDTLLSYAPGSTTIQPGLATECTPNADSTEWTCSLRQGAKFSDGTPVTANDVVVTYAVQWDAADPLHVGNNGSFDYWTGLFGGFLNPKQ